MVDGYIRKMIFHQIKILQIPLILYLSLSVLFLAGCSAKNLIEETSYNEVDANTLRYNQYLANYADLKGYKTLAIAKDSEKDWVLGWSHGQSSQLRSNDLAIQGCNEFRIEKKITDNCRPLKIGDTFFTNFSELARGGQAHRLCFNLDPIQLPSLTFALG